MSKLRTMLAVLVSVVTVGWLVSEAQAAQTAAISVTVTVQRISVAVADATVAFGVVNQGSITIANDTTTVTNDGNIQEDMQLSYSYGGTWAKVVSDTPGADQFDLRAVFAASLGGLINTDLDSTTDSLSTTPTTCTNTVHGEDSDATTTVKGYDIPATGTRNLYFQFRAPSSNTGSADHTITVTVTAQAG